jgi:hypothetical protein
MTRLQDDDIRAMLEARAARAPEPRIEGLPRSTERVAGPVTARRLAMSVPLVGLGVVLVLVVGAVGIGQLGDGPAATRGTAGVGSLTTSSSPGDEWSYQRLADALAAGDLETGSVVLIEGSLERRPEACVRLALCLTLQVRGLESVKVDASMPFDRLLLEAGSHPRPALMAFRVSSEGLEFIGWPDRDPANATTIQELPAGESSDAALVPIRGWLMGPMPPPGCPSGVDASLCREVPPTLRSTSPASSDSTAVEAMEVGITIPVDPYPATIPGPFLVSRNDIDTACARRSAMATTSCAGPPMFEWTVQAALSETPVIRVAALDAEPSPLTPTPTVLPGPTGSMDGATFLTALRQGALDGRVIEITGRPIASTMVCDGLAGASCERLSSWWIGGLEGYGGIPVTAMPCISECPEGVPAAGPYLFVARGSSLVYVGSLMGDLEAPEPIDEGVVKVLTQSEDPHAVHAVDGWFTPRDLRVSARPPGSRGLSTDPAWWMALAPDAVEIPQGDTAVAGPLLIGAAHRSHPECPPDTRGCSIALVPIILGRYDPSRVVRVSLE